MGEEMKTMIFSIILQDRRKGCFSVSLFDTDIYWKAEEYVGTFAFILKENKN